MVHKIDITSSLDEAIDHLARGVKYEKYAIHKEDLGKPFINAAINKATFEVLSNLSAGVEDEGRKGEHQKSLEKINKRLEFIDRIINFVATDAKEVDPRLQKINAKLRQSLKFDRETPLEQRQKIAKVIQHYSEKISLLSDDISFRKEANPQTKKQLRELEKLLKESRIKLLEIEPEMRIIQISHELRKHNLEEAYKDLGYEGEEGYETCLQMGNVGIVAHQIECILHPQRYDGQSNFISLGIHKKVARYLGDHNPPLAVPIHTLSVRELLPFTSPDLCMVPVPEQLLAQHPELKDSSFTFASDLNCDGLNAQFELLEKLRTGNKLDTMAAAVKLGAHHFALALHPDGTISLFDLSRDRNLLYSWNNDNAPYCITFGNRFQAASFLHQFLAEKIGKEAGLAQLPVEITPICDKHRLENGPEVDVDEMDADDEELPEIEIAPSASAKVFLPSAALKTVLDKLASLSDEGFLEAIDAIAQLNEMQSAFPMTNAPEIPILTRIYFHIFHIHDKETPNRVDRTDNDYGAHAFQEGATPLERLRAVQRVQAELLLTELRKAIDENNQPAIAEALQAIEGMKLDANDLPKGKSNLAHALFGSAYEIYKKAQESNPQMVHPHDASFNGDFGRNAFVGGASASVSNEFKLQALQEISVSLKEAWKI